MKKGIFRDWTSSVYHAYPAANKSGLDLFEKSPLHYWARHIDPHREEQKETPAMALGTAIHTAVLEPLRFSQEYKIAPHPDQYPECLVTLEDYRNACKQLDLPITGTKEILKKRIQEAGSTQKFFDDIETGMSRFKLLSPKDWKCANRIAVNVLNSTAAQTAMNMGAPESVILWQDPMSGVQCKARADYLSSDNQMIVDLKTAEDASPEGFSRSIGTYNYHRQAAWYVDGLREATGDPLAGSVFVFIVFEKEPPYACAFYYATEDMIKQGRAENRVLLDRYVRCLSEQRWEGYPSEFRPIDLPAWRRGRSLSPNPPEETL